MSGSLTQAGAIGIGVGLGGFLIVTATIFIVKIIVRRREHYLTVAEIERGFGRAAIGGIVTAQMSGPRQIFGKAILPPCESPRKWDAFSPNGKINHLPKVALPTRTHPAFLSDNERAKTDLVISPKFSRLDRMSSRYWRLQPLSAIIESPRSLIARSSAPPAASTRIDPSFRAHSSILEEGVQLAGDGQGLLLGRRSASPSLHIRAQVALRPLGPTTLDDSHTSLPEKPKPVRSRSIGTFLGPMPNHVFSEDIVPSRRPALHNRSLSFGAQIVGPAPTGPLPPLPLKAIVLEQFSVQMYGQDTIYRSSSDDNSMQTFEKMLHPRPVSRPGRMHMLEDTERRLQEVSSSSEVGEAVEYKSTTSSSVVISPTIFDTDVEASKRTSVSSIRSSLEKDLNHLSMPRIETVERLSVSRVSSCASLQSNGSLKVVSTPTRRLTGSRVSIYGSPAERRKVLKAVSAKLATPQCPVSITERTASKSSRTPFQFKTVTLASTPKPSALKGSPGSRKGHRRQNCVRISTLAPTILGPSRSRSSSPFSMHEIREEGEEGPRADKHTNGDITLRPRRTTPLLYPTRLRASLTPSSPTLSMATVYREQSRPSSSVYSERGSHSPYRAKPSLSRESSLFSIPSFPSPTQDAADRLRNNREGNRSGKITPLIGLTRPSSEWTHEDRLSSTPPFALHVTPSASPPSLYEPSRTMSKNYDPRWPMLAGLYDHPHSGQEYDPGHEFTLYSPSESSSSINSPYPIGDDSCSDPIGAVSPLAGAGIRSKNLEGNHKDVEVGVRNDILDSPSISPKTVPIYIRSSPPEFTTLSPTPTRSMSYSTQPSAFRTTPAQGSIIPQDYTGLRPRRDSDKENASPPQTSHTFQSSVPLPSAASLPSPLKATPVLKPNIKTGLFSSFSPIRPHRPAPSPPSRAGITTSSSNLSKGKISDASFDGNAEPQSQSPSLPRENSYRIRTRAQIRTPNSSPSPHRRNSSAKNRSTSKPAEAGGRVNKSSASASASPSKQRNFKSSISPVGPRPAPARDLRRSIKELRRRNSEMRFEEGLSSCVCAFDEDGKKKKKKKGKNDRFSWFDGGRDDSDVSAEEEEDDDDGGRRRYLKLGREASPVLPFIGFGDRGLDGSMSCDGPEQEEEEDQGQEQQEDEDEDGIALMFPLDDDLEERLRQAGGMGFDFGFEIIRPLSISAPANSKPWEARIGRVQNRSDANGGRQQMVSESAIHHDDPLQSMIVEKTVSSSPLFYDEDEELQTTSRTELPPEWECDDDEGEENEEEKRLSELERAQEEWDCTHLTFHTPSSTMTPTTTSAQPTRRPHIKKHLTPIRETSLEESRPISNRDYHRDSKYSPDAMTSQLQRKSSSVWDEGERYWQRTPFPPSPLSSPHLLDLLRSPREARSGSWGGAGAMFMGVGRENRCAGVGVWSGGGAHDAQSLYDESGFLRSSPSRGTRLG